jgi:ribosomal protein S18 acetylase RimI-like enzyme
MNLKKIRMIRKATEKDIPQVLELLHQVNMVHYEIRPDLFKPHTTKYSAEELTTLFRDESKPVFVFDDGGVQGYAFCQVSEVKDHLLLQDNKMLYIDDICVDEKARGKHVGKALFNHVKEYAQSIGCHHITLNVWEGNEPALRFYQNMGMQVQKTTMEIIL